MGRLNEDVIRYPEAADQTAREPNAVITVGVNAAEVAAASDGIQFLKGTPAGGAHVSAKDDFGNDAGLTVWSSYDEDAGWITDDPAWGGVNYYG